MPRNPDMIRIQHMLDAALEACSFIRNKTQQDLKENRQLLLSLIKEIEMIGEAANKLTLVFRKKYASVPWNIIIATRNRLIHGYFDIDVEIVWNTIQDQLPILIGQLKSILKKIS
ncbi:MAG: hypothetical protein A3I05_01960 [Deltaproteobacteria bacterium RIFCSPLOWO2_02_FULL_44_10]|nr:MAG: hypothetical protein A3C46_08130 [Deltaproteobacteria bacterium RIFCSPHIGHO2_02_FULL_44_16]OGQ47548.1 MAG: hypothetical protein A3I05_01960 [Deltaproteobacteria bacterium RIFCSPLOWO2_02_FULL_44_10]